MNTPLENILINAYKEEMISFMQTHPEYFDEAVELAVSDKQPHAWRAAWLLWSCIEENDQRLQKHLKTIIEALTTKNDGHQRELLKILQKTDLNEDDEGYIFDICMTIWEKINKKPSVRMTALQVILKIAKKHPELAGEIKFITQDHYLESLSPGIKRSIERLVKAVK